MVKIFIGNVAPGSEESHIKPLFEEYGTVSECAIVGNYAFVHMDEMSQAEQAIAAINGRNINGNPVTVELSHGKKRDSAGGPMRGRGGPMNGAFRGRGGPPRPPMMRGSMRPGFRPRPWDMGAYGGMPPFAPRMLPRGFPRPPRGMGPRGGGPMPPRPRFPPRPPGPPRGGMRGAYPRPPPPGGADYYGVPPADPSAALADPNGAAAGGEYDYYAGGVHPGGNYEVDPNAAPGGGIYDNYSTADYSTAEGYDQSAYYGDYSYDYSQDPNYAAPAGNGVRYNPYATQ